MARERDAEEVVDLALGEREPGPEVDEAGDLDGVARGTSQIARMRRLRGCDRKLATTS